jgi:uncharacterized membrane protein YgcG
MNTPALLVLIGVVGAGVAQARQQTLPQPIGRVNDFANVLDSSARADLESLLQSLEDETWSCPGDCSGPGVQTR